MEYTNNMNKIIDTLSDGLIAVTDWWNGMDWDNAVLYIGLIALIVIALLMTVVVFQPTVPVEVTGYLVGKEYTPAETHTGVGSGISTDGKPVTVVTTSYEGEKWTLIVQHGDQYTTYDVTPETYYSVEVDHPISIQCNQGKWIDMAVSCK